MAKKILALLIIPLAFFCLCGCGSANPRLTEEEYSEALTEAWQMYLKGQFGAAVLLDDCRDDFSAAKGNREKAEEFFAQTEEAFVKFEDIRPPEEYDGLHGKLIEAMEYEKEWVKRMRSAFEAETEDDFKKAADSVDELVDSQSAGTGETFPGAYIEIYRKMGYFGEQFG